jgi:ADP-ribosylglycohydrolase
LIGTIIGDIAGSRFEFSPHKSKDFELMTPECRFTDDTVMTVAVAKALTSCRSDRSDLGELTVKYMKEIGRRYPDCGYGENFRKWIFSDDDAPYGSYGNGSAMRVSACGYAALNIFEAIDLARITAAVTHDHPEGIKGAQAVAAVIFLAKDGWPIDDIKAYVDRKYYPMDKSLDEIRAGYSFDETCQGSVPQALEAFFESEGFEDAVRNAVSLGGDSDTQAAIAGSAAEVYWGVPQELREKALSYLDDDIRGELEEVEKAMDIDTTWERVELI